MAVISDKLVLEDGFSSTLDKYVDKLNQVHDASLRQRDIEQEISQIMQDNGDAEQKMQRQILAEKIKVLSLEQQAAALRQRAAEQAAREEMQAKMDLMRVEQQAAALRQRAAEQAEAEARAEQEAAEAAQRAAERHQNFIGVLQRLGNVLTSPIRGLGQLATNIKKVVNAITGANSPMDGLIRRIRMTAMGLFTARRMITYIKNALQRAPEEMSGGIGRMSTMIKDGFDRAVLSLVRGFLPAMDRLKAVMDSSSGQNLLKAFSLGMETLGRAIGFVIDKISVLVDWMGDNLNTVLIVAASLLSIFAAKMLLSAAATAAAHPFLLLIIGTVIAFGMALDAAGVTAETVVGGIGYAFGWLYATIYNAVSDIWNNALAPLGEAFAEFLVNPLDAASHLFWAFVSSLLEGLNVIANALDSLFGTHASDWIAGAQNTVNGYLSEFDTSGLVPRMEKLDVGATAQAWSEKANTIGSSFSMKALEGYQLTELQDINKNTGATAKKVDMAAEDLKAFVDMAEREYVMRVNLNTVTPNITVNGQNTGNTREDGEALANRLAQVLAEMRASSPSVPVDYLYTGGIG